MPEEFCQLSPLVLFPFGGGVQKFLDRFTLFTFWDSDFQGTRGLL